MTHSNVVLIYRWCRFVVLVMCILAQTHPVAAQSLEEMGNRPNILKGIELLSAEPRDLEKAEHIFEAELKECPQNGYAYFYLANIAYNKKSFPKAVIYLNQGEKFLQGNATLLYPLYDLRKDAYMALNDIEKAVIDTEIMLKMNPLEPLSLIQIANKYITNKKYEEAYQIGVDLTGSHPHIPWGIYIKSRCCIAAKNYADAIRMLGFCTKEYPEYELSYTMRAEAEIALEKYPEAASDIITAISMNAENEEAHRLLLQLGTVATDIILDKLHSMQD